MLSTRIEREGDVARIMIAVLRFSRITTHLCSAVSFSDYSLSRPVFLFVFHSVVSVPSNTAPSSDFHRHAPTNSGVLSPPPPSLQSVPSYPSPPSPATFRFPDHCNLHAERDTNIACRWWSGRRENGSQYDDERRPCFLTSRSPGKTENNSTLATWKCIRCTNIIPRYYDWCRHEWVHSARAAKKKDDWFFQVGAPSVLLPPPLYGVTNVPAQKMLFLAL